MENYMPKDQIKVSSPGFSLEIVQQPGSLSASFFQSYRGNDRKSVINPCPILQLIKIEQTGEIKKSIESLGKVSTLIGNVSLLSVDEKDVSFVDVESLKKDPKTAMYAVAINEKYDETCKRAKYERVLDGTTVSQCHILRDLNGNLGAYFIFEDISVNLEGDFKLKICIYDISVQSQHICCTITNSFRSLNSKEYNCLGESSEISKLFARQGIRIPITRKSSLLLSTNELERDQ